MKWPFKTAVVLLLVLFIGSCQPFYVSTLPSFLGDTVALRRLNFIDKSKIFGYDFFSLRNNTGEYIFIIAIPYIGKAQLYILNDKLETIDTTAINNRDDVNFLISKLRMVDANQKFLIGRTLLNIQEQQAIFERDIKDSVPPFYNLGAVIVVNNTSYNNCLFNKIIYNGIYNAVSLILYNNSWETNQTINYISENTSNFKIVNAKRTFEKGLTALVTWEERTNGKGAFCYLFNDDLTELASEGDSLDSYPNFPLGFIYYDYDYFNSVYAVADGLLVRSDNGVWRLFEWETGGLISQNNSLRDPTKHLAFGEKDYYYIFDTQSLYLYKAKYWWKN